jgi:hypothetical protein
MPSLARLIAGATATTGAVVAGRLGVIVLGGILGLLVLLICALALVAVYGDSAVRKNDAMTALRIVLGREDSGVGGSVEAGSPGPPGAVPEEKQAVRQG